MALTGRTPEIATAHAGALFYEVMEFFMVEGLIDFNDNAARGGEFVFNPRIGQLASKPLERADVSSLGSSATVRSTVNKQENAVVLRRQKLHEFFDFETLVAGIDQGWYDDEIGKQLAIMAGQSLLTDIYRAGIGSAGFATIDHLSNIHVDTATAADQVDLTVQAIQNGKFKMTDQQETIDWAVTGSKAWNDIRTELITNDDFRVPNIVGDFVRGQLYRTIIGTTFIVDDQMIIDEPSVGSNAQIFHTLLFRSRQRDPHNRAPINVSMQRSLELVRQHVTGEQSTRRQMQVFADWAVGISGASWDTVPGGANPTNANLTTPGNWDESTQDDDELHGIIDVRHN